MEDFVLVFVGLLALRCQRADGLRELVHRVNRLGWVVEHERTSARHAKFDTLHNCKFLKVNN